MDKSQFPRLFAIANDRDHLTTAEFGKVINRGGQTIRKNLCLDGKAYGITPERINGRLLWPVADIIKLLKIETAPPNIPPPPRVPLVREIWTHKLTGYSVRILGIHEGWVISLRYGASIPTVIEFKEFMATYSLGKACDSTGAGARSRGTRGARESAAMVEAREMVTGQGMTPYAAAQKVGLTRPAIYMAPWYKEWKKGQTK